MNKHDWLECFGYHSPLKPTGTMRKWFEHRNGKKVATIQVTVTEDGGLCDAWAPGARTVDARASYVLLDESRRDYSPGKVLHSTEDTLIMEFPSWGERVQVCIYQVRD